MAIDHNVEALTKGSPGETLRFPSVHEAGLTRHCACSIHRIRVRCRQDSAHTTVCADTMLEQLTSLQIKQAGRSGFGYAPAVVGQRETHYRRFSGAICPPSREAEGTPGHHRDVPLS